MESKKELIRKALKSGWIENWKLVKYYGVSALRRVRDLKSEENIEKKRVIKNGVSSFTWAYRIKKEDK